MISTEFKVRWLLLLHYVFTRQGNSHAKSWCCGSSLSLSYPDYPKTVAGHQKPRRIKRMGKDTGKEGRKCFLGDRWGSLRDSIPVHSSVEQNSDLSPRILGSGTWKWLSFEVLVQILSQAAAAEGVISKLAHTTAFNHVCASPRRQWLCPHIKAAAPLTATQGKQARQKNHIIRSPTSGVRR